jgi:hypothetical protein
MTQSPTGLTITAHRDLADGDDLLIRKGMAEFIGYGEFDFIMFGGARGGDTFALAAALDLRTTGPKNPKLIVVVPDTLAAQPRETWATTERADQVIELHHKITRDDGWQAFHRRDHFMVDWVFPEGRVLAFWNNERSGTGNTVFYARDMGVEVSIRPIKGIPRGQGPIRTSSSSV